MLRLKELETDFAQQLQIDDPEERYTVADVTWLQYESLLIERGDSLRYRIHYLDGVLEILAPSRRHETSKTRIGDLLFVYFLETDTQYYPTGSTTFRKAALQVGTEPDESYCIGTDKAFPDLVIEVIVSSGGVERLERYRRLGVREVWFWQRQRFTVYHLETTSTAGTTYRESDRSQLLPCLDLTLLGDCLQNPNPLAAAKLFRQGIRDRLNP
jgi:Uma2 family endonuclease